MKTIMGYTQKEAIEYILSCGWLPDYPVRNVPLTSNYFWDGIDRTCAYAWGAALSEIERRKKGIQLSLFPVSGITIRKEILCKSNS